jgi:hypothetical protein
MRRTQVRSRCTEIVFTMACLLVYTSPLVAQVDCKLVTKATKAVFSRTLNVPTHAYTTSKMGGHIIEIEMIYVDGSLYLKSDLTSDGQWTLDNSILKQAEEQVTHNPKSKNTCRYLGDEPLNGEMAGKYSLNTKTRKRKTDELVWISKASGLLLRDEKDWGDGLVTISHFGYNNVKPPPMK